MPAKAPPSAEPARRVTMTDVATQAAVSQSTVSLVLNGMTGTQLSDETRARVLRVAAELGYRLPDRRGTAAASARGGRRRTAAAATPLILYLVDEISTSPHPVLSIDGAKDEAWSQGALVAVFATRSNAGIEAAVLSTMLANPALIGVVYSTIFTRQVSVPPQLGRVPTVLLNCSEVEPASGGEPRFSSVEPSEVLGGFAATECLLDAGHRRIAFINGEPWMDAARDRLKGYRRALASADIAYDAALVREGDWHVASGHDHTLSLMKQPKAPTAIFCANDLMAVGCLEALRELGKQVPRDVAVIGYDDQEIARHTSPPLTTLVLPNYEMGRLAVETLLAQIAAPDGRRRRVKVDGRLVLRQTVG
jgi:LacI family transcriptional regulator